MENKIVDLYACKSWIVKLLTLTLTQTQWIMTFVTIHFFYGEMEIQQPITNDTMNHVRQIPYKIVYLQFLIISLTQHCEYNTR